MVDMEEAPLAFLKLSTITQLAGQLNSKKIIPTDDGLLRDWRGVFELAGFRPGILYDKLNSSPSPFLGLVEEWKSQENSTVHHLFNILKELDRYDVIDDNQEKILEDVKTADAQLKSKGYSVGAIETTVAGSETVLTYDDIVCLKKGQPLARYNALVLYADEDSDFVLDMVRVLEEQRLSVCLLQRDVVAGTMEIEAMRRLIEERCEKVLVVISPDFFSRQNKFFSTLAQSESIQRGSGSYIPIIYRDVANLPGNIRILTKLTRNGRWFWSSLCKSIRPDWTENKSNPLPPYIPPQSKSEKENLSEQSSTIEPARASLKNLAVKDSHRIQDSRISEPKASTIRESASESRLSALKFIKPSPTTPERKTGGLISSVKKRFSGLMGKSSSPQQFSNAVFNDADSSVAQLLKDAPEVPKGAPGATNEAATKFKKFGKSRAQSYQQF